MSFYENNILPHMINCLCGMKDIQKQRQKVVPLAEGKVLEVGMGSGLNLPFYDWGKVDMVWGLEPSEGMRRKAQKNLASCGGNVEWLGLPGESIPLDDNSADTVLLTYTLCTIPDWEQALSEMRRVLKPDGKLIFCEHGEAPDAAVKKWQDRVNPVWKKIAGGCNLNRPIPSCLKHGGFNIRSIESEYLKGPKIATYNYWGEAF